MSGTTKKLELLPLRDVVIFPQMIVPLFVGRPKSIAALEAAMNSNQEIFLVAQKQAKVNDPREDDLYRVGTISRMNQTLKLPDGTIRVLVEGVRRARLIDFISTDPHYSVNVEAIAEVEGETAEQRALRRAILQSFESYLDYARKVPKDVLKSLQGISNPGQLADTLVLSLNLKLRERQELLETYDPTARLERLYEIIQREIEILQVEQRIKSRIKKQMDRDPNRQQGQTPPTDGRTQGGPGGPDMEQDEFRNELKELEDQINKKGLTEEARSKALKELKKLRMMSPMSAEATVVRNYLDWMISLPWDETTEDNQDIDEAEKVLEEDHYGLKKPKERILEYLAVRTLVKDMKGPILCFIGPPGVGKTSIAKSISRATGRKFVRLSLGGVRDEAEIRGHRRTYIGALPGKLLQMMKKAGTNNPVMLLDEIDKMSSDFRGDPASALLEALDPEQNNVFNDHYLDVDYDLSKVMFLTTANYIQNIPPALKDRMEVIQLPGYTEEEKVEIARRYLMPKQQKNNGLQDYTVNITEGALRSVIFNYTREAGVRNLERELGTILRKIAVEVLKNSKKKQAKDQEKPININERNLEKYLGVAKFRDDYAGKQPEVGFTNGLAWTEVGGTLLQIEVNFLPGKGHLSLTGKLGDVMKESAQAALSWVRTQSDLMGLSDDFFQKHDIHVHVPEGAVPKDGPSAGVTIATSLVSALTGIPVRNDIAMTGETTLHGRVLPIGGLKEKILAAHRYHIKDIIIPEDNEKDLKDVPKHVMKALVIHPVKRVEEVLDLALVKPWIAEKEPEEDKAPDYVPREKSVPN